MNIHMARHKAEMLLGIDNSRSGFSCSGSSAIVPLLVTYLYRSVVFKLEEHLLISVKYSSTAAMNGLRLRSWLFFHCRIPRCLCKRKFLAVSYRLLSYQ